MTRTTATRMMAKALAAPSLLPRRPHAQGGIDDAIGLLIYLDKSPDNPWTESFVTLLSNRAKGKKKKIESQNRSLASKTSGVEEEEDDDGITTTPYMLHNCICFASQSLLHQRMCNHAHLILTFYLFCWWTWVSCSIE